MDRTSPARYTESVPERPTNPPGRSSMKRIHVGMASLFAYLAFAGVMPAHAMPG